MAKRNRKERPATDVPSSIPALSAGDHLSKELTVAELKQLMSALGAAGAVLLEAANLIEEVIASGSAVAIEKLQSLQGASWRLGFRADALSDDVLKVLPEVAVRLGADEPPAEPSANTSGSEAAT